MLKLTIICSSRCTRLFCCQQGVWTQRGNWLNFPVNFGQRESHWRTRPEPIHRKSAETQKRGNVWLTVRDQAIINKMFWRRSNCWVTGNLTFRVNHCKICRTFNQGYKKHKLLSILCFVSRTNILVH